VTRLVGPGVLAALGAAVVTTTVAAVARGLGADLAVPDGEERIPLAGVTTMTVVLSLLGVALALAVRAWSDRPARVFLLLVLTLTALSLVPPLLAGGDAATTVTLVALHLLAAAVVVPVLTRRLDAAR
jgi:predicted Na+-dependent transporter